MDYKKSFTTGLHDGIPICLGYISVSFAFGIMAAEGGLPIWMAVLISMTNLTSAGQFAGTGLIISGGSFLEIAITTFVINIRYMLMSLSLCQKFDPNMKLTTRAAISFGHTDEIFAVGMQHPGILNKYYMTGLILTPYFGWAFGTLMGAISGSIMPISIRSALGLTIYAMFIAIIIPPARKMKSVAITLFIAIIISCLIFFLPATSSLSAGWRIILCAVIASAFSAWKFPISSDKSEVSQQ